MLVVRVRDASQPGLISQTPGFLCKKHAFHFSAQPGLWDSFDDSDIFGHLAEAKPNAAQVRRQASVRLPITIHNAIRGATKLFYSFMFCLNPKNGSNWSSHE